VTGDGFTFDNNAMFVSATNSITTMSWSGPAGNFEQNPDEEFGGTILVIGPQPGTYPIQIYEVCLPTITCNGPNGPIATVFATVTDATVATPEPSLLALLLCGGLLCLLYRLRTRFVLPTCRGCAGTGTT
jgi:hypothetical protein